MSGAAPGHQLLTTPGQEVVHATVEATVAEQVPHEPFRGIHDAGGQGVVLPAQFNQPHATQEAVVVENASSFGGRRIRADEPQGGRHGRAAGVYFVIEDDEEGLEARVHVDGGCHDQGAQFRVRQSAEHCPARHVVREVFIGDDQAGVDSLEIASVSDDQIQGKDMAATLIGDIVGSA